MSDIPQKSGDHGWDQGWNDHKRQQRRRMAALTLEQKLDWLEEAHRMVMQLQQQRAKVAPPTLTPGE